MTMKLEFEKGTLVKVNGMRPQYMSGNDMISLICYLGQELHKAKYHIREVAGCLDEVQAMPCASLRERLHQSIKRAEKETQ